MAYVGPMELEWRYIYNGKDFYHEKRIVGGVRYKARRRGRSSPDSLAFRACEMPEDRADYCMDCSFLH